MKRYSIIMKRLFFLIVIAASQLCASAAAPADSIRARAALTLDDLQVLAINNNHDLQRARLDISMAEADAEAAFTNFFPSLQANAIGFIGAKDLMRTTMDMTSFGQTYGPALMQAGLGELLMGMPPENKVSMMKKGVVADVMAMQPIFAGGQIVNGNRLAALQKEVRRLQLKMSTYDVLRSVSDYYWQIIALRSNLATLDAVDAQLDSIHTLTENFINAGMITRNDLLTVELKQQETASNRLQLNNGMELLRLVLAQLCGADTADFDVVTPSTLFSPAPPSDYFVPPTEAVYNRVELELAGKNVEAKALQVRMERGKALPTVAIGAVGMYQGIDMGDMSLSRGGNMHNMSTGNLVGLATVSIPISDWWSTKHAVRKARLTQQQAEIDREEALEKLQIDIVSAWNNLNEAYSQIAIARKSIVASNENLRINRNQYTAGTLPMTDLMNAITLSVQAQSSLNAALATYQQRIFEYVSKTR